MNAAFLLSRPVAILVVWSCLSGCNSQDAGDEVSQNNPSTEQGVAANSPAEDPWIVLSNFTLESGGLNNEAQVSYRFVRGEPNPNQDYYWFVEEASGAGSAKYWGEPVKLNASGGTLTMDISGSSIQDRIYTFIAIGPRSSTYSDPEPVHISGDLYLGQSESSSNPIAPDQAEAAPQIGITAILKNSRRTPGENGELISIDYEITQLPEVTGFWLSFIGSEGGSVSYDVGDDIRSAPKSGTLSRPVPDPEFLLPPYEVKLKCQPFGAPTGSAFDTIAISETIQVE